MSYKFPLEKQLVSLDLAIAMKEAGFKQEGIWWWVSVRKGQPELIYERHLGMLEVNSPHAYERICVAYTVSELGEALPKFTEWKHSKDYEISIVLGESKEQYDPENVMMDDHKESAPTEANARARACLHLRKKS